MNNPQENKAADAHTPLISVVLPIYNGEQYLAEAIESILAQSFTDFELIMIDDGSTDGSLAILKQYQTHDARIRLVSRENRNLATTLNDSIDLARGKWTARMDQDDIALPHRLERQLHWLELTGADLCGSWVRRFGSSDKRVLRMHQTDEAIKMEMLFSSPFAHSAVMMRTDLVRQLRYDNKWEKAEDYDLWERAVAANWKMTNVQEVLLLYRMHESQISTITSSRQQLLTQQIRHRYWTHVLGVLHLDKSWIDEVLNIYGPDPSKPNMNVLDAALIALIRHCDGEAQDVVLYHAIRLYYRVAKNCPDIVLRWRNLNRTAGRRATFSTNLRLWLLYRLRIRPEDRIFHFLRRLYVSLVGKT